MANQGSKPFVIYDKIIVLSTSYTYMTYTYNILALSRLLKKLKVLLCNHRTVIYIFYYVIITEQIIWCLFT